MKAYGLILAAAAAAALTGCGSPTDSVTFQAPPNFHQQASFGPFMQLWESSPHNVLMLLAFPVHVDMNKAMQQSTVKDAKIESSKHITICNGQDALYAEVEGEMNNTGDVHTPQRSQVEFLMTDVKGRSYMALYVRPLHEKPDTAAESAIKNLCPK